MHIKSKRYLKNRLNEFVSVSDLDISDLKDNLLPIIKGVDTYCWSYIKIRERNSSRVVPISLKTDSEVYRLFDAVKETNSVWKFYKNVPSPELEECFAYFDIQRSTDFKQLLEDPECRDIIEKEANVKFIFNSDRKKDLHLLAKERRRFRREQEKVNDIYSYFNYTWDEQEALAAVTNKKHVWVVRTNEYPNLPALFFYPKSPINSKDEEELISKYSHKLATAYKYELRDPSVNAYWLARPCRYPWFKEHPMPDGSELIIKINESENKLTNMNTLSRDRNTLKRLVESYGKNDVLNFVRRLNESAGYQYQFYGYVHGDMLWNIVNDEGNNIRYDWWEDDRADGPCYNPRVAKALENIYAPGKIQVSVEEGTDGRDLWYEAGGDGAVFKVVFNFNNDLNKKEAAAILYDFGLINAQLDDKFDAGTLTLRDLSNNEYQDGDENYPSYGGDYTALARLAGIRR